MSSDVAREVLLSATVLAQDEEARLGDCLDSLSFCDEIVVVDGGSRDGTRELARSKGARVLDRPFDDFARQHQFADASARGRWILSLDADERVSPKLAEEIRAQVLKPDGQPRPVAFSIPFRNHFRGVPLRHGGLSPDCHLRLYLRERCHYDPGRAVHEKLVIDAGPSGQGAIGRLQGEVLHFGWLSLSQALRKSERYAEAAALSLHARGQRGSALRLLVKPLWRFVRGFFLQTGFLDGVPGALVAGLRAYEAFAREARLWELSRFPEASRDALR